MTEAEKCPSCDGCGLISSSDDHAPWTEILKIPLGSAAAVLMGLIRPLPCRECAPRIGDIVHNPTDGKDYRIETVQSDSGHSLGYGVAELGDRSFCHSFVSFTGRNLVMVRRREQVIAEKFLP